MNSFRRLDPRWIVLLNHTLLVGLGIFFYQLPRSGVQVIFALICAIVVELLAAHFWKKNVFSTWQDRSLSAVVSGLGTLVLLRSPDWWFYGFVSAIAIASKYLITGVHRRHVFNPTNFAIVFSVAVLPNHLHIYPDQFSNSPVLIAVILCCGTLAIARANRWRMTLGYFLGVLSFGVPIGAALGYKSLWILAPEINTSTLTFVLTMITDPKTSPSKSSFQWLFGAIVAVAHLYMRFQQVPYSSFIALLLVTGIRSALPTKETT